MVGQFEFDALSRLDGLDIDNANPFLGASCLSGSLGAIGFCRRRGRFDVEEELTDLRAVSHEAEVQVRGRDVASLLNHELLAEDFLL